MVAREILNQLGGNRFAVMTGARNFVDGGDFLMFTIPRGRKVKVRLNGRDLYDVTVGKVDRKTLEFKALAEMEDVYCDQLEDVFTALTGLYTRF